MYKYPAYRVTRLCQCNLPQIIQTGHPNTPTNVKRLQILKATVDGRHPAPVDKIVDPIIYRVLYIPRWLFLGFLNHPQYHSEIFCHFMETFWNMLRSPAETPGSFPRRLRVWDLSTLANSDVKEPIQTCQVRMSQGCVYKVLDILQPRNKHKEKHMIFKKCWFRRF